MLCGDDHGIQKWTQCYLYFLVGFSFPCVLVQMFFLFQGVIFEVLSQNMFWRYIVVLFFCPTFECIFFGAMMDEVGLALEQRQLSCSSLIQHV